MNIVIVDYKLGNLRSVAGAVDRVGYKPLISNNLKDILSADKLILPGVGAFGDGIANIHRLSLVEPLTEVVISQGKPILGICLGAQLMAKESHEFGCHEGLNWIDADVLRIKPENPSFRVPHVGWNGMKQIRKSFLFDDIPQNALFYYIHSYYIAFYDNKAVIGTCEYGQTFTAVFKKENICGTQFHPEKSQLHGLQLLKNFLDKA